MKFLTPTLLLLVSLFASCSTTQEPPVPSGPPQWVSYEAVDGNDNGKHIVLVSGDEEYRSEEALPQLAKILSTRHGFNTTVLFAQDPENPGVINPNYQDNIPGLHTLADADLMVLFTRFRALPDAQMSHINEFLLAGKPLVAIRTATHAFEFDDTTNVWNKWSNSFRDENSPWHDGFGRLVLGERWHTHHGHHKHQSTSGLIAPDAENHPIRRGIEDRDIWGPTDVYGIRLPMDEGVTPIILGQVINRAGEFDDSDRFFGMRPTDNEIADINPASNSGYNPNDPLMPIAWTKPYQLPEGSEGTAFTSTIGSSTDMESEGVRRLLVNAVYYLLDLDVPAKADVQIVGSYSTTPYNFHTDEYWAEKNLKVEDYLLDRSE